MTGFQTKKLVARMMPRPKVIGREYYSVVDKTQVDSSTWYTITCTNEVAEWIRDAYADSNKDTWYEHKSINTWTNHRNVFDIHEKIYTMLSLKWA